MPYNILPYTFYHSVRSCSSPDDNVTVTASPDLLTVSGSWVTVTYKGVESPSKDDMVAVYSPTPDRPSLDPHKSAPVKYIVSVGGYLLRTHAC